MFVPAVNAKYRELLTAGMTGFDVAALQLNLGKADDGGYALKVDGVYGPATVATVKAFQTKRKLAADGEAGYHTQRNMAQMFITPIGEKYSLPPGLLGGLTQGESGWYVGALAWHPVSVDIGWCQMDFTTAVLTEAMAKAAFDGSVCFDTTAAKLRMMKNQFMGTPGGLTNEAAWKLSLLDHNWPSGAFQLAEGKPLSTQPADWVIAIGVPNVTTPAQWAAFYIATKIEYVTSWPA
jgi:peptidoglycan hydrolase-like protein with peptidoglycan-binding domain